MMVTFSNAIMFMFIELPCDYLYSGTPLNDHTWLADTHDIVDTYQSPDWFSIHFNS